MVASRAATTSCCIKKTWLVLLLSRDMPAVEPISPVVVVSTRAAAAFAGAAAAFAGATNNAVSAARVELHAGATCYGSR